MPSDDRNLEPTSLNCYCTDVHGKACRYETERPGKFASRCRLFGKVLRNGRDLQSIRCKECRAIDPGQPLPEPKDG